MIERKKKKLETTTWNLKEVISVCMIREILWRLKRRCVFDSENTKRNEWIWISFFILFIFTVHPSAYCIFWLFHHERNHRIDTGPQSHLKITDIFYGAWFNVGFWTVVILLLFTWLSRPFLTHTRQPVTISVDFSVDLFVSSIFSMKKTKRRKYGDIQCYYWFKAIRI